jgi:hypothetical protein
LSRPTQRWGRSVSLGQSSALLPRGPSSLSLVLCNGLDRNRQPNQRREVRGTRLTGVVPPCSPRVALCALVRAPIGDN